jgi:hypothetical protein
MHETQEGVQVGGAEVRIERDHAQSPRWASAVATALQTSDFPTPPLPPPKASTSRSRDMG